MNTMGPKSLSSLLGIAVTVGIYAAGAVFVLMVCILFLSLFADLQVLELSLPVSVRLEQPVRATAPSLGIIDAEIQNLRGEGRIRFETPNRALAAMTALGVVAWLALLVWILVQLRGVFRTLRAGRPFVPANAVRIRRIGYGIIVGELAIFALSSFGKGHFMNQFKAEGLSFDVGPELNLFAIAAGLIILVIAEVFRAGTALDEEQSLTV